MSFAPILPFPGYAGWRFLSASLPDQTARFSESPVAARDMQHFRDRIGQVTSASDLVNDFRLLRVALGAFGLQADLPNRAFIERVLSDGVAAEDALSNRLADKRYRAFSEAFGFGSDLPPRTQTPGFSDRILAKFTRQDFERAVGEQDNDMRLALTAQRELTDLASRDMPDTTAWLTILGTPPLREVLQTALGLPDAIAGIDLDQQIESFRDAAERRLGHSDVASFSEPDVLENLIRNFTIRAQAASGPSPLTPGYTALTLLQPLA
jgi:hypothetical protein